MMNRLLKTLPYVLLSTLTTVWGCRKDVEEFRPYVPILEDLEQLLSKAPGTSTHTVFLFGGSIPDTTLTTASGVRVFLADTENLFADDAGTPVPCSTCPSLKMEVTTVLNKGDLLARGLPTMRQSDNRLLESAGVVRVQASCNGQPLQLRPGRYIKIQAPATDILFGMQVFQASYDATPSFTGWETSPDTAYWADWLLPGGGLQTGYEWITRSLGWSNCARPLNEQSSSFCVTLPSQFNALNTRVYLVFDQIRVLAELKGNQQDSRFCFPKAPIGYPIRIVAVGKTGEQYWLVQKPWEIGSNTELTVSPQPLTEKDVLDFIKSL